MGGVGQKEKLSCASKKKSDVDSRAYMLFGAHQCFVNIIWEVVSVAGRHNLWFNAVLGEGGGLYLMETQTLAPLRLNLTFRDGGR